MFSRLKKKNRRQSYEINYDEPKAFAYDIEGDSPLPYRNYYDSPQVIANNAELCGATSLDENNKDVFVNTTTSFGRSAKARIAEQYSAKVPVCEKIATDDSITKERLKNNAEFLKGLDL